MLANVVMPSVYKRGEGAIKEVGSFVKNRVNKVLISGGKKALQAAEEPLVKSLKEAGVEIVGIEHYGSDCTFDNINRISDICVKTGAELLIAVGGGKALDTGKAAADKAGIECVTIPTIAATCAAIAPLSVVYDDNGVHIESIYFNHCPVGCFVDTGIIAKAPSRWLYSGMGDTLAKWYELRATTGRIPKTSWTIGGITNGKICYDIIKEFGAKAKEAVQNQTVVDELGYVIDAIIFYAASSSILGGEKCRGAASHAIYFGFTNIPSTREFGHGLLVGYGNLCLLALEGRSEEEILEEIKLAKYCGVPTKLAEIGELNDAEVQKIAEVAANAFDMQNMPFKVTPQMVVDAMRTVDSLTDRLD